MQDSEAMTIGMWIDYIIEWNDINRPKDKGKKDPKTGEPETKRRATQADFDSF